MFIRRFLFIISIVGSLFFFIKTSKEEKEIYDQFFDFQISFSSVVSQRKTMEEEILFTVHIPRINLERVVYTMDSSKNDVDYNVQILNGSDLGKNFLFLAAHSGVGGASYFNRLVELEVGDIIWIDKGYEKLYFVVETLFYIPKNGYLEYSSLEVKDKLYLITCSLEYSNQQFVVKAMLVY